MVDVAINVQIQNNLCKNDENVDALYFITFSYVCELSQNARFGPKSNTQNLARALHGVWYVNFSWECM